MKKLITETFKAIRFFFGLLKLSFFEDDSTLMDGPEIENDRRCTCGRELLPEEAGKCWKCMLNTIAKKNERDWREGLG